MKKVFLYCLSFLFSTLLINAQEKTIQGIISDSEGKPIEDAYIKNITTGSETYSNENGSFSLSANLSDSIKIEHFNYEPYKLNNITSENLKIVLENKHQEVEKQVGEIVITALGITKQDKKVGYSTQEIKNDKVEKITTPSLGNLFTGQVAGLQVSNPTGLQQAAVFKLRGKDPLIVIDDVPVSQETFESLSPNEINSINILKGTSASALYGSRGRNGAVMITTRSAKKNGISIELSQSLLFSSGFTLRPQTQKEYGNGSNGKYEFWDGKDGGVNDGDMIWGPKFVTGLKLPQWNSPVRDKQTGEIIPWYGTTEDTPYADQSRYERVPIDWTYHDNLKEFMKTGMIQNTNFSINFKNEKGKYRVSGNYINMVDRIPGSRLSKGGLNFTSSTLLAENLEFKAGLSYSRQFSPNIPNYEYNPSGHMYTVLIWMGGDVNGRDLKNHLWLPGLEGYKQANWNYAWYNNPWFGAEYYKNKREKEIINGRLGLTYYITEKLKLQTKVSLISNHIDDETRSPKSYFNYSASREGKFGIRKRKFTDVNYDILASYDTQWGDNIEFTVNAGASGYYNEYTDESSETDGLLIPGVYNLGNSSGAVKSKNFLSKKAIYSLYSTAELGIYRFIYLALAARNDWSSTLPENNRSFFYPSASLSVLLSQIIHMPRQVNYLKLYGSWAKVSGDLDPYSLKSYYLNNQLGHNGNPVAVYPTDLVNSNIRPETTISYETGISSAFFSNRLSLDIALFLAKDKDQIIRLPVSESSGFETRLVNGNEYTTRGVEVSIGATVIKNKNFSWKTLINWSTSVKKITKIYGNAYRFGDLKVNDRADAYYDYGWMKSVDGRVILDAGTGLPTRDNYKTYLGHFAPDWTFGFNNTFKINNFKIDIGIDGSIGGVMRSEVVEKMWWGGKHPKSTQYRDLEYAKGEAVYVPQGVNIISGELIRDVNGNIISDTRIYQENTSTVSWQTWAQNYPYKARVTQKENSEFANVFDKTFVKLRSIILEYDFSSLLNEKHVFKGIAVNIFAYNLLMWKKSKNLYSDPDFNFENTNDIQDPSTRWLGIGFNVKF
ncbi:SusC/RagA family TonB-linked outer membrane protein [Apibacter raozihei]|uniref:SusC/RagA family TonB-linked outer membrane protein n=1 Tax=Apibacter raozihei TaxID=2500547 RepID=UPI000FE40D8B|nr:SusC/RagA family TonB-linked outer membrane protein [Apibacter raozihei]